MRDGRATEVMSYRDPEEALRSRRAVGLAGRPRALGPTENLVPETPGNGKLGRPSAGCALSK